MSTFLFSMGQDTIEEFGIPPSVTGYSSRTNPTVVGDEADLSVNSASESSHEEATIDQSVNGISSVSYTHLTLPTNREV